MSFRPWANRSGTMMNLFQVAREVAKRTELFGRL